MDEEQYRRWQSWRWWDFAWYLCPLLGGVGAAASKNYSALGWIVVAAIIHTFYVAERVEHWKTRQKLLDAIKDHLGSLNRFMGKG